MTKIGLRKGTVKQIEPAPILPAADSSKLVTPKEAAEFLGVSEGTLATWRCVRRYSLPYAKIGSRVMYRLADLEGFVASRTVGQVA